MMTSHINNYTGIMKNIGNDRNLGRLVLSKVSCPVHHGWPRSYGRSLDAPPVRLVQIQPGC